MKKLLFILFLFIGSISYGQTVFTQTYVDRCTGNTQVVVANFVNGSATVAFYDKVRTFTYQEFLAGELQTWLTETYIWWQSLSPCSTATAETQQAQQTAQNAAQAASTASTAATNATSSVPPPATNTTNTNATSSTNTTGSTSQNTSNTSTGGNEQSSSGTSSGGTEGGTTDSGSSTEGSTNEGGQTSESEGGDTSSETQESSESDGGGDGENQETESKESESSEENKEESKEEVEEESSEEESSEEDSEEDSEESDEEESEDSESEDEEEKEEKQKKMLPIQLRSDIMANQALLGNYDIVTSFGATQSSIFGDETYGATAMIWSNLRQFSLNTSYTKIHMTNPDVTSVVRSTGTVAYSEGKSAKASDSSQPILPKLSHITSASVGYMNNFGNGALMANVMKIKPTKHGTFGAGINVGNMFAENDYQSTMVGYNLLYTNQVMLNPRITYAPAFIWTQTPFVTRLEWVKDEYDKNYLQAKNQMKGQRIHGMMILANSFTIQLTRRFSFNAGATFIKSTDPNIPLIKSFMIGAKLPF